jgi:signal transduction histidine kinase
MTSRPRVLRSVVARDVALVRDVLPAALILLGLCISVPLTASTVTGPRPGAIFTTVWAVALALPLVWRRRWPSTVTAVVCVVFITGQVAAVPEDLMGQLALMIVLYTVGAVDPDRRRAWLVRGGVVAMIAVWIVIALLQPPPGGPELRAPAAIGVGTDQVALVVLSVLGNVVVLTVAIALGETAWVAAARQRDLQARTVQLRQERDRVAQQAIALDRMRIARELHDVVAHHVSLMGVQASLARRLLVAAPDKAGAALDEVEAGARRAVHDLGALLTTLREDVTAGSALEVSGGGSTAATAPSTNGLHRLPELVEEARRSGFRVQLHLPSSTDLALVPAVAGYTVYRLVQEALTNTRKHAGPSARVEVHVEVRHGGGPAERHDAVEENVVVVSVSDDGERHGGTRTDASASQGDVPTMPAQGSGLGLTGMQERVQAAGGRLRTGHTGQGFLVEAVLPLEARLR